MGETENRVSIKERRKKQQTGTDFLKENKSILTLFVVIVAALAVILISILVLKIPVVAVCAIVVIEGALAACLHDVPVWLHGLNILAQIIAGALCGRTVFIVLCVLIYLVGILALRWIRD